MKLFLNGGGDGPQAALAYQRFSEIIDHAKPLLYIPLAMEPERYPGCLAWITEEFKELRLAGINMVSSMRTVSDGFRELLRAFSRRWKHLSAVSRIESKRLL